jgi:hypothetical protein
MRDDEAISGGIRAECNYDCLFAVILQNSSVRLRDIEMRIA